MLVNCEQMKQIENASGISVSKLMQQAGSALANEIKKHISETDHILILAGNGNNGGDGFVIAHELNNYACKVYLVDGKPKTKAAQNAFQKLAENLFVSEVNFNKELKKADIIIDAIYGFGYHGLLKPEIKELTRKINLSSKRVFSVDINSGCEADTGTCDPDAIQSELTFALDCYKPFHMLRKNHQMFKEVFLLPLDLPHDIETNYLEMNEEVFFQNFPKRKETAYKGSYGHTVLIGGSYGMAGALGLNILGAKTIGSPYIDVVLPEEIYPILGGKFITPVYHPFSSHSYYRVIEDAIDGAKAIGFGSGAVYMPHKQECLDLILQDSHVPIVFDAEALRLLKNNTYILRFAKAPVILTPHIGEFASLINLSIEEVMNNRLKYALQFAKEYQVTVVLKSPNTIVASPSGEIYLNQSGNATLAQAGSGDLLTGMITSLLTMQCNVFLATCMAVWLHGYIAECAMDTYAMQSFDLETYPSLAMKLWKEHNL